MLAAAALVITPDAARAGGVWGPGIDYLDGIVCRGPDAQTALVSWPGPSGPAFALGPVSSPPAGRSGPTRIPAVGGASNPLAADGAGLSPGEVGAIAYLIAHHGHAGSDIVADVAARIVGEVSGDVYVTDCFDRGVGGLSSDVAARLWDEAQAHGGPYQVTVVGPSRGVTPGRPAAVTAEVTSSSGAAVAGAKVTFASAAGSASPTAAVTDASGRARTEITTPTSTRVTASISAVGGLIETTAGSAVPLVSAAGPVEWTGTLALATRVDPSATFTDTPGLVVETRTLRSTLQLDGLRGHDGTATVSAYGPLAYSTRTGCLGHTTTEWRAQRLGRPAGVGQAAVHGDGRYPVTTEVGNAGTAATSGCFQLAATLTTSAAVADDTRVGPVVTVAPIAITAAPTGHGLAAQGPLASTLTVRGGSDTPSDSDTDRSTGVGPALHDVTATLVGPRAVEHGSCPTSGWASTRASAATVTVSGNSSSGNGSGSRLRSTQVDRIGCYGFRISAQLRVPGLPAGTVQVDPGPDNPPTLVLAPRVMLASLSATHVYTGGHVMARVDVAGSAHQPGSLRLQLLRLPYTSSGCIGRDWNGAVAVPAGADAPTAAVNGDGIYRVRSGVVASRACWTVAPVFTANANLAVQATGVAGADPSLAFLSTGRTTASRTSDQRAGAPQNGTQILLAGVLAALVLVVVLGGVIVLARRSRNSSA